MSEHYVWAKSYKSRAVAMLNAINGDAAFPIVGNNAKTGQPAPDKCKTERWADEVTELEDGRWCIPRIPAEILDRMNVAQSKREAMLALHKPAIVDSSTLPFKKPTEILPR